jgi:hypothetical protein
MAPSFESRLAEYRRSQTGLVTASSFVAGEGDRLDAAVARRTSHIAGPIRHGPQGGAYPEMLLNVIM